ncbi:potassium-transporting ATPase subunit KdpC [Rhodobacteraceae bacterium CH30]|nr:potassium-transporting ATPase subunit KdpC [Rhodobacteraceae bacterium CH30]
MQSIVANQNLASRAERALWWPATRLLLGLTVLLGLIYPLAVTGLAQVLLPAQANGSLIVQNGQVVGSALIGQSFGKADEFWGRPSATASSPYNGAASGGSNLGPANPALAKAVAERIAALKAAGPVAPGPVPADLVTASASGLDPHISLAAALYQVPRIAKVRHLDAGKLQQLVLQQAENSWFGSQATARVNVLRLNMALPRG